MGNSAVRSRVVSECERESRHRVKKPRSRERRVHSAAHSNEEGCSTAHHCTTTSPPPTHSNPIRQPSDNKRTKSPLLHHQCLSDSNARDPTSQSPATSASSNPPSPSKSDTHASSSPRHFSQKPLFPHRILGSHASPTLPLSTAPEPIAMSRHDITSATSAFRHKLGEGGFGRVYKGHVWDAQTKELVPVAVKVLTSAAGESLECEVMREIATIDGLRHPCVLRLIGYCTEGLCALVYEYMPRGDVAQMLRLCRDGEMCFPWERRMAVALGCAQALAAMHEQHVVHRDFKASNVLLAEDLCPRVADFGLMKPLGNSLSHATTLVKGTIGYIDPLYFTLGHLHFKSDVYAFGVFIVELVTGQSVHHDNLYETLINRIVGGKISQSLLSDALDPRIRRNPRVLSQAKGLLDIARLAMRDSWEGRPTMMEIVQVVKRLSCGR